VSKDQAPRRIITDPSSIPTLILPSSLNVRYPEHTRETPRLASFSRRSHFPDSPEMPVAEHGTSPRSKENRRPRQSISMGEMSSGGAPRPRTASKTGSLRENYNKPAFQ